MSEIIFHQYAMSPFSEKVRKVLAFKTVRYHEVDQPAWMPKPELTPLTGGYRRIPVMQIGADVYCDSALIVRKIEELYPEPSVYPDDSRTAADAIAAWADGVFFRTLVPLVFTALAEHLPKELFADRQKMSPGFSREILTALRPNSIGNLRALCDRMAADLEGRPWILGAGFSVADAAVYHCLWFARNAPEAAVEIKRHSLLEGWMNRIDAMGKGSAEPMSGVDALATARDNEPITSALGEPDPCGLAIGDRTAINQDDLPSDIFEGTLLSSGPDEIVLSRTDEKLGNLALHFPRAGFTVRKV
ncbi:MAG: glutathione S-transferase [Hyphomicrobiaceae bacterium]|jgi:glutathione S-transferase